MSTYYKVLPYGIFFSHIFETHKITTILFFWGVSHADIASIKNPDLRL